MKARTTLTSFSKRGLSYAVLAAALAIGHICAAQNAAAPADPLSQELSKYPGLLPELGKLAERMKNEVQLPAGRNRSQVLPLLPDSTTVYAALPNYGQAAHQALAIFKEELRDNAALRDWWQHSVNGAAGVTFEDSVEKFYELSQYLGDEVVVSGDAVADKEFFAVAEVKKPGLKQFLQSLTHQPLTNFPATTRVLDEQDLAAQTADAPSDKAHVILVTRDLVVVSPSIDAAKAFMSRLSRHSTTFASTPLGQRIQRSYSGGTGFVVATDLQKILRQLPVGEPAQTQQMLTQLGFDNLKFLVWEHRSAPGQSAGQVELSFTGPRHGIPSWLAAPAALNSLDFISPKAVVADAVRLKNFAEIYDSVQALATVANPNAFASLEQMQQMMGINLRNDLLSHLDGEIAFELDGVIGQQPAWKAIFRVNDPEHLQQTLTKLLAASGQQASPALVDGIKYYSFAAPAGKAPMQINYAFCDGYLVIASSRELIEQGVQAHRSGVSFAKSANLSSTPNSQPVSALMYYVPAATGAARMQAGSPEVAQLFSKLYSSPVIARTYADEDEIRVVSNNSGADVGVFMVIAAVAVPNLLHARSAANEASAVGTMRNIVTAQVTYAAAYPQKGYARDLASLGRDPRGTNEASAKHAALLGWDANDASCSGAASCTKSGYHFVISSQCQQSKCKDFTALATPVSANTGTRSFCVTSDGVLRFNLVAPASDSLTSTECRGWTPLQ